VKKLEKERSELKRALEGKEVAVEKAKRERDEMWALVNNDKYRTVTKSE
jgi:hypothetical protein